MKFYRRLQSFKAISFDLDDTLYSNKPIMQASERAMLKFFTQLLPQFSQQFNRHYWAPFRRQVIHAQPQYQHDVVVLRLKTYTLGLKALSFSQQKSEQLAQQAVDFFLTERSNFRVPQTSHDLLKQLSYKYPLVAISNGNVDTKAINIHHYFDHIYHAGFQANSKPQHLLRKKPASDMFLLACQQLNIHPSQLLHVGDCGNADIQGALNAGCQTAWLSCYNVGQPVSTLPHIELTKITDLSVFID